MRQEIPGVNPDGPCSSLNNWLRSQQEQRLGSNVQKRVPESRLGKIVFIGSRVAEIIQDAFSDEPSTAAGHK